MDEHTIITNAVKHRLHLLDMDKEHGQAFRLFNGYTEGIPGLVIEIFSNTLVFFDNTGEDESAQSHLMPTVELLLNTFPWIDSAIIKTRHSPDPLLKRGSLVYGKQPSDRVTEHGIQYALDLQLNQDASFYLDTRLLRAWLTEHADGKYVLNTFAYTGSFGAAALAGNARQVIQTDINKRFLTIARRTYQLNHFSTKNNPLLTADFFKQVSRFKTEGRLFDIVIIDPPIFSNTSGGRVDMVNQTIRLINKARPLVAHNGHLIVINNALYVSGHEFMQSLQNICESGYARVEELIPVPEDIIGKPVDGSDLPVDPSPFNHATKIAALGINRKDQAAATHK